MRKILLFAVVAITHYTAHFLAWAYNVNIALQALSFPALPMMDDYTLEYFEIISIVNSVIWAVFIAVAFSLIKIRQVRRVKLGAE